MTNYDILLLIFQNISFLSKIKMKRTCDLSWCLFKITDLYLIDKSLRRKLSDRVLKLSIFNQINSLNAKNNSQA